MSVLQCGMAQSHNPESPGAARILGCFLRGLLSPGRLGPEDQRRYGSVCVEKISRTSGMVPKRLWEPVEGDGGARALVSVTNPTSVAGC